MTKKSLLILLVVGAAIAAFFIFDLRQYFTIEFFVEKRGIFDAYYAKHPVATAAIFFLLYVAVTAVSFPGATIMTLFGGALFGLLLGTVLVSFASSIGATLAFLASRLALRDWVQNKFGDRLAAVNAGVEREGWFYLLTLRLLPIFPFFAVNLLMGLTNLRTWTFYWVSQAGMLAATILYVYAGTQLGQFEVSFGLLLALSLLLIFPLAARWAIASYKARKVFAKWSDQRPRAFDYNLVVIGAGSAGLVTSYIAAATKARVALVEKHKMGGDCLNTGCVPSKALLRSAKLLSHIARAREFGIVQANVKFEFADVMQRVRRIIETIEPHDSVARYSALGVDCIQGTAKITTPWTVEVQTTAGPRTLSTKSIVIAAGARPFVPPIPGIESIKYLTSDTVWDLSELPKRLVVLGGGPIGCELAQGFARLGSSVTQVEMLPRLMVREDPEVSQKIRDRFMAGGIDVRVGHKAVRIETQSGVHRLIAERDGRQTPIEFDHLLVAVGRVANTSGYGLEDLGINVTPQKTIETDDYLQTLYPNIYACGDVAGPYQFTHTASHQAWYAAVNALFGTFRSYRADYRVIPWATFTDPEVARVGINEQEAQEKKIAYTKTVYNIDDLDRAITDSEADGFVKVLTVPGSDKILGVTIVGEHAGDLIAEYVLAMKHSLGLNKILGTIHIYPTLVEANKYAAGAWKRSTVTHGQWTALAAFQAWRRGAGGFGAVLRALIAVNSDKRKAYSDESAPAH
ncbi:MAG: FAD-dependent oxidoreductase [Burkholderiaceae bacterium]|nr:FAD-dependent oxidoreductase [Burkholderiaceae bacterium]